MASTSEASFGARLANAHKLADALNTFPNYSPPNNTERVADLKALLTAAEASNAAVAMHTDAYNNAVKARELVFRKNDISVMKLISPIRLAVVAQFGKDSREEKSVSTVITRIRNSKLITYKDSMGNEKTISQSEQSYGSLTQLFKDLISILSNFTAYNPSRDELKVSTLATFADTLEGINQAANISLIQINTSRNTRNAHYDDLHERAIRIKAYVSSEYGFSSTENKTVKGLKI